MVELFKFKKFKPDREVISYANGILPEISELAPSDSILRAGMTKLENAFVAWIEILSPVGKFSAEGRAEDPRFAVDILDERIKLRLKKWKSSRWPNRKGDIWGWPMTFDGQNFSKSEDTRDDLAS